MEPSPGHRGRHGQRSAEMPAVAWPKPSRQVHNPAARLEPKWLRVMMMMMMMMMMILFFCQRVSVRRLQASKVKLSSQPKTGLDGGNLTGLLANSPHPIVMVLPARDELPRRVVECWR